MLTSDRAVIAEARRALDAIGYRVDALAERLGTGTTLRLERTDVPALRLRLDPTRGLDALALLLLLELEVDAETVRRALGDAIGPLLASGLVEPAGECLRPGASVVPHDDLLIASDRHDGDGRADIVPGVQRPSDLLARLTPRPHVSRALDLGTGCGIQALLLARHCEQVVATDISPRALAFAAFNAAMNGVGNIEFREGSLLEPVTGEQFDLIVSNPPYVISPESRYVFRDSGRRGDELCRELIAALPDVLSDAGIATILVSWSQPVEAATATPVQWLDGGTCSALVLVGGAQEPHAAAVQWNQPLRDDPERFQERVRDWIKYFENEGIERIGYGGVVLRRRDRGPRWVACVPMTGSWSGMAGEHVLRIIAAHDMVSTEGSRFLDRPMELAPDAELIQTWRPESGGVAMAATELRLREGLAFKVELDSDGALLVGALAEGHSLAATVPLLADQLGRPVNEVAGPATELAHQLFTLGFFKVF
ncbi:MAG: methyltransferase [Acidimicrobiales bacterium]